MAGSDPSIEAQRGQDAPHRVRQAGCRAPAEARRPATRDVHLPRLHALLRLEPRGAFRGEASYRPSAADPQVARRPREAAASDACAALGAAPVAVQRAPRALPLLRSAEQLASDERVLPRAASWLVPGARSPEPAAAHVAPLPAVAQTLPPSVAVHHAPPPGTCLMPRSTSGGAECGKAARSDLWGRKPNG